MCYFLIQKGQMGCQESNLSRLCARQVPHLSYPASSSSPFLAHFPLHAIKEVSAQELSDVSLCYQGDLQE